jgi:erythronate-4-phosphate dehydrogenase
MMKITVDENIAYAKEAFSQFGDVELLHGRKITPDSVKDSDALIVRSITKVDKNLLEGSKVKFVGTATIGKDHIDLKYLKENNIAFADAAGCNAHAVKEYVFTALADVLSERKLRFKDLSIGIIGAGNVGSKVAYCANALGMKTIINDPPLKRKTGKDIYKELDEALKADIITLHVPLNKAGIDKTYHLLDYERLNQLKDNCILINSSRGSVINNEALEKFIEKKNFTVILDVWENEPVLNPELLKKVYIGTPHIAGYSYEGKVNGTTMIYSALCKFLNEEESFKVPEVKIEDSVIELEETGSVEASLQNLFKKIYDIKKDDANLRRIEKLRGSGTVSEELTLPDGQAGSKIDAGKYFDTLRKEYHLRYEFPNYFVVVSSEEKELIKILSAFRFKVN